MLINESLFVIHLFEYYFVINVDNTEIADPMDDTPTGWQKCDPNLALTLTLTLPIIFLAQLTVAQLVYRSDDQRTLSSSTFSVCVFRPLVTPSFADGARNGLMHFAPKCCGDGVKIS